VIRKKKKTNKNKLLSPLFRQGHRLGRHQSRARGFQPPFVISCRQAKRIGEIILPTRVRLGPLHKRCLRLRFLLPLLLFPWLALAPAHACARSKKRRSRLSTNARLRWSFVAKTVPLLLKHPLKRNVDRLLNDFSFFGADCPCPRPCLCHALKGDEKRRHMWQNTLWENWQQVLPALIGIERSHLMYSSHGV
jgi:hypothetical protein